MTCRTIPRTAVFRCDADPDIGGGHVVRCQALADELARQGWRCTFAVRDGTRQTVPSLVRSGHTIIALDGPPPAEADWLSKRVGHCDLLIADHYQRDRDFEAACRGWADRILVLDDANERNHDCDLLVCPSPTLASVDFSSRVRAGTTVLAGPAYAPLRAAFADRRFALDPMATTVDTPRLLISFGATDPGNATGHMLEILRGANLLDDIETDVMLGYNAPYLDTVTSQVASMERVQLHVDPPDAVALMANATLTVGAAGTTAWERCALGAAAVMVSIADNQRPGALFLAAAGAAADLGPLDRLSNLELADTVRRLLNDPAQRADMEGCAAAVCDGLGAARIAAAVDPPLAADGGDVRLRPVSMSDDETILAWQSHPQARQFSRNPSPPARAEHADWMARTLRDPARILSLVLHRGMPAGLVRLDRVFDADDQGEVFDVSVLIAPDRQRLGLGRAALDLAHRLRPAATLIAEIYPDNTSSQALFLRAGYSAAGRWRRKPPITTETSRLLS